MTDTGAEPLPGAALHRGELAKAAEGWWQAARQTRDAQAGRHATAWSAVASALAGDRPRLDRARAVLARCAPPATAVERLADAAQAALEGRAEQVTQLAQSASALASSDADVRAWAELLTAEAQASLGHPSARVHAEQARAAAEQAGLPYVIGRLDLLRADRAVHAGDAGTVSESRAPTDPLPAVQGRRLGVLARAALVEGRHLDARRLHERAIALLGEVGDGPGVAASVGGVGLCRVAASANAEAVAWLTQAIHRAGKMGALSDELLWRSHLDDVLGRLNRNETRVSDLLAAISLARKLGRPDEEAALWRTRLACCEDVFDRPGAEACRQALATLLD